MTVELKAQNGAAVSSSDLVSRVSVDWDTLEIVVRGPYEYRADLEGFTTAAKVLDWIYQIGTKTWCDAQTLKDLVDALDAACMKRFDDTLQGVFCPFGQSGRRVNWKNGERMTASVQDMPRRQTTNTGGASE
jgi:hypothetical protein